MTFKSHSDIAGQHAFLGASKYHWLGYDEEKLRASYQKFRAAQRGTELHEFAKECIRLGIRLPNTKRTLNMYVNDAISFKMSPEVILFYSYNSYGQADAISFRRGLLRIHDLKTGVTPASMNQPLIYSALFCLEYRINPENIRTELRIYQDDAVLADRPDPERIRFVMDRIVAFDKIIESEV